MPSLKAERLGAKPTFYVLRWRWKAIQRCHQARAEAASIHDRYARRIEKVEKSTRSDLQKRSAYLDLGDAFHDEFEEKLQRRVEAYRKESSQEGYDIINLMLPAGVAPAGTPKEHPYWTQDWKGQTPVERLARARLQTHKKLAAAGSLKFKESVLTRGVGPVFEMIESYIGLVAVSEAWLSQLLELAYSMQDSAVDVIDHWEFVATLDELTCEECAALDGTTMSADQFGNAIELTEAVDVHPNCRCVMVPVTKSWEELGFPPLEDPEGSRIERPYYPEDTERGRDWGPSSPTAYIDPDGNIYPDYAPGRTPVGGDQGYVPTDTRYKDWQKGRT